MLFNSYNFLFVFLPIVLIGFQLLRGFRFRFAVSWLVLMSLVYYGWWNPDPTQPWSPKYVLIIVSSCLANYLFGRFLAGHRHKKTGKAMLTAGVAANLALLGYYKYLGFFAGLAQDLTGGPFSISAVALPLGISFFTFQQIAYLVDAYRGETEEYHISDYFLFVTFFPQLIAGPIVHHKDVMPQFARHHGRGIKPLDLSVGLTIFAIGLFKKVVIADELALSVAPLFELAENGTRIPTVGEAWAGSTLYALQIYFDFSGYSDMAIGCSRLFGIRLPLNFASPYKASSIIEFWRRWHMTLSRFLRDYLYFPLGGNRLGTTRRYSNLLVTMLLGGLWHGAGWTFVVWGGLHGLYLCINHFWHHLRKKAVVPAIPKPVGVMLTFVAVLCAWVYFRAPTFHGANNMLHSMWCFNGFDLWPEKEFEVVKRSRALRLIIYGLLVVWLLPNTQEFMARYRPAIDAEPPKQGRFRFLQWRPTLPWAFFTILLLIVVGVNFDKVSEFIYFQF